MAIKDLIGQITEPNLRASLEWANDLTTSNIKVPKSLEDVNKRAEMVNKLDPNFGDIITAYTSYDSKVKDEYFNSMTELTKELIPDIKDDVTRVSTIFRLWAGCLSTAKTIALETKSGDNTPEIRKHLFENLINPLSDLDPIYKAGVEAAKLFKDLREQPTSFEGVPKNSPIVVR